MKKILTVIILFSLFLSCSTKSEDKNKSLKDLLIGWYVTQNIGDQYSKTFYLNPLFLNSSTRNYDLYFPEATSTTANSSTNKKLIIIHGWQSSDKDINSFPNLNSLKTRLVETIWKDLFNTNFLATAISKNYDIYFYTYLTSESVSANANRFKIQLDSIFGTQSSNVVIFAHSMGGLVARGSLYEYSSNPTFLLRILTAGTPYHGSPWASNQFQGSKGILGDLASFLTNSAGGQSLAWDNFNNTLTGASNSYLSTMNGKSGRDNYIYAYYGSLDSSASGYAGTDTTLTPGCSTLGSTFSPSDCIVPVVSASGIGLLFGKTYNMGAYHHTDINLRNTAIQTIILSELP